MPEYVIPQLLKQEYVEPVCKEQLSNLCKRFISGLREKHNLTLADLVEGKYRYIGGYDPEGTGYSKEWANLNLKLRRMEQYLKMNKGDEYYNFCKTHGNKKECICSTKFRINCFVESMDGDVLVIGSCCIDHFSDNIEGGTKMRCSGCKKVYKNALKSRCKECRDMLMEKQKLEEKKQKQQKELQMKEALEWSKKLAHERSEEIKKQAKIKKAEQAKYWDNYRKELQEKIKNERVLKAISIPFAKKDYYKENYYLKWDKENKTWLCYAKDYEEIQQSLIDNKYKKLC